MLWKFGRGGDFKMDSTAYFSFQHTPYINPNGDLMLFDNGLYEMQSGALAFKLDEKNLTAATTLFDAQWKPVAMQFKDWFYPDYRPIG